MKPKIDLILLGPRDGNIQWSLGEIRITEPTPCAVAKMVREFVYGSEANAWLFWDPDLGSPDAGLVEQALALPGDLWHAGLLLGMGKQPDLLNCASPTWMLNRDPDLDIVGTSWRLSLRACLVRTEVLRQIGGPRPGFEGLEAASLEMGHRCVTRGVLPRHVPWLLPSPPSTIPKVQLSRADELRFMHYRFGRFWSHWALLRAVWTGRIGLATAARTRKRVYSEAAPAEPLPYVRVNGISATKPAFGPVTVLIPTVDRYPYLRVLLNQFREHTIRPLEIIIVDQTAAERRDTTLAQDFKDLPLHVIYLDKAGQCSSRNTGLGIARGDFILLIDDDDEIPANLIESHLENLQRFNADVSCGVANEVGAGALPENFTLIRHADVFPANNSLIRREVLEGSGLFDLAYEKGARADHDLGMRIYLSGALMVLNPEITVLHHHAPQGGLRTHKARVITYARSRNSILIRQLPPPTEIYLARRFFSEEQVREMLWQHVVGTFSIRGGIGRKLLKVIAGFVFLPSTLWQVSKKYKIATDMLSRYPSIPRMSETPALHVETR